jgi:ribosomal protein L11 methyltransferase
MDWVRVTVDTAPGSAEMLAGLLAAEGYETLEIEDESDFGSIAAENEKYWGASDVPEDLRGIGRVSVYLENDAELPSRIRALEQTLRDIRAALPGTDLGSLNVLTRVVSDGEWKEKWKEYYRPVSVGERFIILPEWEKDADTGMRIPIVLDPGTTFGTGTHATTAMCMRLLEGLIRGGEKFTDLGCGSGVLSAAALLLGAGSALGVDIDPLAVSVSRANTALNGFGGERYRAVRADLCTDDSFLAELARAPADVVVANIVSGVIISLAPKLPALLKAGGYLVCSGILDEDLPQVETALSGAGFTAVKRESEDGWSAVLCRK